MKGWHNLQFKKPPRSDKYYLTVIKNDEDEFTHYSVTRWRYNEFIDLAIDIIKHFRGSKIYWRELPKLPNGKNYISWFMRPPKGILEQIKVLENDTTTS